MLGKGVPSSEDVAPLLLYRMLLLFVLPLLVLQRAVAVLRGKETGGDLVDRWRGPQDVAPGTVWLHAASVGEINSVAPLLPELPRPLLITTNTVTARDLVRGTDQSDLRAELAPFDRAPVARRMMQAVDGHIIVENELWPNRLNAAHQASVPIVWLGARMSKTSARRWGRFSVLVRHLLRTARLVVPQDEQSAERLRGLGVRETALLPPVDLKSLYRPRSRVVPADLSVFDRDTTVLAAATHPGEEEVIAEAFALLLARRPDARLILAPRHPDRASGVVDLLQARGWQVTRRSSGDAPDGPLFLADTLGEMDYWYRLAGAAFIGGSLVAKGGHTPHEPAAYGCAILHGPHTDNFAPAYAALNRGDAALLVHDARELARGWDTALTNRKAIAARAKAALQRADIAALPRMIADALRPTA